MQITNKHLLTVKGDEWVELQSYVSALRAERDELRETLESISALIEDDMGEWYAVEFAYLPVAFANRAHIRDAIAALAKYGAK